MDANLRYKHYYLGGGGRGGSVDGSLSVSILRRGGGVMDPEGVVLVTS